MKRPAARVLVRSNLSLVLALASPSLIWGEEAPKENPEPVIKVIATGEQTNHLRYRRMLVGPGFNEPKPYPGYTGFVGWQSVARTRSGDLLVAFTSGYWHGSPPTPITGLRPDAVEKLRKIGMPDVEAPKGGRAEIMRSTDGGLNWTAPEVLIDTPLDDRAPGLVQLSDGTLLASFFTWPGKKVGIIRSLDDGRTWEPTPRYMTGPFKWAATDGPPIELPDKSVLLVAYAGHGEEDGKSELGVFRSSDRGDTWKCIATLNASFNLDEPSIARVPDGRLVIICRREGALSWSKDNGYTWTAPVPLPMKMYDPWLLTLRDGTLLCVHGSYTKGNGGVRAILSPDQGQTWTAAGPDFGFSIDPSVYGYSRGIQMPDGSIYMVYQSNGGHTTEQVKRQAIFATRFRVLEGCQGIELLPAPSLPADQSKRPERKPK